jgi:hypothetical protein
MKKLYVSPAVVSEGSFETSALACAKTADPPPGSCHFGPGFGAHQSATGSVGIGFGPGGTSLSYFYSGLCINWVTLAT